MKKILLAVLALFVISSCSMASEGKLTWLGNDIAGFISTNAHFLGYKENDPQKQQMGFCQYSCMDDVAPGMLLTMRGYTAQQGEGSAEDHVNFLADFSLHFYMPWFENPTYKAETFEISETQSLMMLIISEQDNSNAMIICFPFDNDGHYGELTFEGFTYNEETLNFILDMIWSYQRIAQ